MTSLVNLAVLVLGVTATVCLSSPYCQRLPGTQRNMLALYFLYFAVVLPSFFSLWEEMGEISVARNQTRVHRID